MSVQSCNSSAIVCLNSLCLKKRVELDVACLLVCNTTLFYYISKSTLLSQE